MGGMLSSATIKYMDIYNKVRENIDDKCPQPNQFRFIKAPESVNRYDGECSWQFGLPKDLLVL